MSLPYDYARCEGKAANLCRDCQRRTSPGRPEGYQTYLMPWPFPSESCDHYVAPERTTAQEGSKHG